MTTLNDIYSQRIIELSANIPRTGRLDEPDATATAHSKLCGSTVTVDIVMRDGVVTDYGQSVKACLLGQTSAAVMGANAVGSTPDEIRTVARQMREMLKNDGPPPSGKWADLAVLEPVRDFKARHTSTLLVFEATLDAIARIETAADATGPTASAGHA